MLANRRSLHHLRALDRNYFRLLGQVHDLHQDFLTLAQHDEQLAGEVRRDPYRVFNRRFLRRWELIRNRLHRVAARRQSLDHQLSVLRARRARLLHSCSR